MGWRTLVPCRRAQAITGAGLVLIAAMVDALDLPLRAAARGMRIPGIAAMDPSAIRSALLGGVILLLILVGSGLAWALRRERRRRARAARAARETAAQLNLVADNTGDLLLTLDWDGTRRFVSPACERLLGRSAAALVGGNATDFIHFDDQLQFAASLSRLRMGTLAPGPITCRLQHGNGQWRWFEAQGQALPDGDGAVLVARDVTERRQMEERLRQSQRLEAVGRLTAGVAHDFNNLLQSLMGGLELALDEVGDSAAARENIELALQAVQRGARLTSHLLSLSLQQVLRPAALELAPMLSALGRTLERTLGHDVAVSLDVHPDLPCALADAAHLDSALLNLCLNARDAMPEGGRLRINAYGAGEQVVVAVSDTGEGMPPEVLARACEPFFSTKGAKGSGLGLSMVQDFARQSGGDLRVQSTPGEGTRIEIWLPLAGARPVAAPKALERAHGQGRVLVVDDERDVRRLTAAFLRKGGFEVTEAGGGDEALTVLAAPGPAFDALVTDFAMPGMDGAELIVQARELRAEQPALVITGYAGAERLDRLPPRTPVLHKPFEREELVRRVSDLVGASAVPAAR